MKYEIHCRSNQGTEVKTYEVEADAFNVMEGFIVFSGGRHIEAVPLAAFPVSDVSWVKSDNVTEK